MQEKVLGCKCLRKTCIANIPVCRHKSESERGKNSHKLDSGYVLQTSDVSDRGKLGSEEESDRTQISICNANVTKILLGLT